MVNFLKNFPYSQPVSRASPQISDEAQHDSRLKTLHELFIAVGATHIKSNYNDMNAYAQEHWLRKPGQERQEIKMFERQVQMKQIEAVLKKIGMIDRVNPTITHFDYAIVFGARVYRMRSRMQNIHELISTNKFMPKQIVILTGDRPLNPEYESKALLLDTSYIRSDWKLTGALPTTETEAARFIWDQLKKPDSVKNIPIVFVSTSMFEKNGKLARPTTVDTVESWLKLSPKPGSVVAFSNNPYILYQNETIKPTLIKAGWFKQGGTLQTVGDAFSEKEDNLANVLDSVAGYIYSILQVKDALGAIK
jgi:hypothetical protein